MSRLRFRSFCLIFTASLCFKADAAFAQTAEDAIKQDKVHYLYPLSTFIKSSQTKPANTLTIGILGKDPFDGFNKDGQRVNHLDEMARASNAERTTTNRRQIEIQRMATMSQYKRSDLLFVSNQSATNTATDTPEARLSAALERSLAEKNSAPFLIVSDTDGFAKLGSPLNFYRQVNADGSIDVRIELNPEAARRTGFDNINPQFFERLRSGKGRIVR